MHTVEAEFFHGHKNLLNWDHFNFMYMYNVFEGIQFCCFSNTLNQLLFCLYSLQGILGQNLVNEWCLQDSEI